MTKLFIFFLIFSASFSQSLFADTNSMVLVRSTVQYPNFLQPWRNKNPETRVALGVYVGNGQIVCPSQSLYFATNIEIKKNGNLKQFKASVVKTDPDLGLTVIQVAEPEFGKDLNPVKFGNEFFLPQTGVVHEFSENSNLSEKKARVTSLEMDHYSNGYRELPIAEIQSEDKIDGNGELVVESSSKLPQGIIILFKDSSGTGRLIPNFQIAKFLEWDGKSQCFPFKGFRFRPLTDKVSREYYYIKKEDQGVLVAEITPNSSASTTLQLQDVILEVGNFKIDPKGNFQHPKFGKISLSYLFHSGQEFGFSLGKQIPVKLIRGKRLVQASLTLQPLSEESVRIPHGNTRNVKPSYTLIGGLVFLELSEQMLSEFGNQWRSRVDKKLLYLNDFFRFATELNQKKFLVLAQVLPIPGNRSYHNFSQLILYKVNGKEVSDLNQLKKLVAEVKSKEEYLVLDFEDGNQVVFDSKETSSLDEEVKQKFGISN